MSEQENTKLIQQAYSNFQKGDTGALLNLFTDNITWQLPAIENVPFSGRREGREQASEFFATLADDQEVLQFEPRDFIAQGDRVVALGQYRWRVKATGREYGGDFAHVFTIRDGKISGFQEFMDTAAAAAAHQKASAA